MEKKELVSAVIMVCWPFAQHRKQHKEQQPLATRALTVLYFCFSGEREKGKEREREREKEKGSIFPHTRTKGREVLNGKAILFVLSKTQFCFC